MLCWMSSSCHATDCTNIWNTCVQAVVAFGSVSRRALASACGMGWVESLVVGPGPHLPPFVRVPSLVATCDVHPESCISSRPTHTHSTARARTVSHEGQHYVAQVLSRNSGSRCLTARLWPPSRSPRSAGPRTLRRGPCFVGNVFSIVLVIVMLRGQGSFLVGVLADSDEGLIGCFRVSTPHSDWIHVVGWPGLLVCLAGGHLSVNGVLFPVKGVVGSSQTVKPIWPSTSANKWAVSCRSALPKAPCSGVEAVGSHSPRHHGH